MNKKTNNMFHLYRSSEDFKEKRLLRVLTFHPKSDGSEIVNPYPEGPTSKVGPGLDVEGTGIIDPWAEKSAPKTPETPAVAETKEKLQTLTNDVYAQVERLLSSKRSEIQAFANKLNQENYERGTDQWKARNREFVKLLTGEDNFNDEHARGYATALQRILYGEGAVDDGGGVDGKIGPKTIAALLNRLDTVPAGAPDIIPGENGEPPTKIADSVAPTITRTPDASFDPYGAGAPSTSVSSASGNSGVGTFGARPAERATSKPAEETNDKAKTAPESTAPGFSGTANTAEFSEERWGNYENPHQKPRPIGEYTDADLRGYFSSTPGNEPAGGPQLMETYDRVNQERMEELARRRKEAEEKWKAAKRIYDQHSSVGLSTPADEQRLNKAEAALEEIENEENEINERRTEMSRGIRLWASSPAELERHIESEKKRLEEIREKVKTRVGYALPGSTTIMTRALQEGLQQEIQSIEESLRTYRQVRDTKKEEAQKRAASAPRRKPQPAPTSVDQIAYIMPDLTELHNMAHEEEEGETSETPESSATPVANVDEEPAPTESENEEVLTSSVENQPIASYENNPNNSES